MTLPAAGILVIDKEPGWTSHDVVAALRPLLGTRRVGHGGTLDPPATGVLPVLYGQATRLADRLHRAPKAYLAELVFGEETTTDDASGEVLERAPVPAVDDAALRHALAAFVGPQLQRPPAYAAISVGGERAYVRARRGDAVDLAPRPVEVHEILLLERGDRCAHVLVTCSGGTYVRALARDLGRALGTRGHLGALRRVAAAGFSVDDALTVEEARELASTGVLGAIVHHPDAAALELDGVVVARDAARRLRDGVTVGRSRGPSGELRAYDAEGGFVGLVRGEADQLRPHTIFPPEDERP